MRLIRVLPSMVVAMILGGCESSNTEPVVSIDAVLAQMSSSGIAGFSATAGASTGMNGLAAPSMPGGGSSSSCSYNTGTTFFVCAPFTANGLTITRSFQLRDASGAALSTPNPLLLASVRSIIDVTGTIAPSNGNQITTEITRHEDATLSGIMSANRVLNGNSTQRLAFTGQSFTFVSNDTSATTNLQLPATVAQKYPLGGTIVTDRTVTSSGVTATTHHQHEEISFDGSSIMTVKITIGTSSTVSTTCKVNLASPATPPVCT